jgi:hypothetical protein
MQVLRVGAEDFLLISVVPTDVSEVKATGPRRTVRLENDAGVLAKMLTFAPRDVTTTFSDGKTMTERFDTPGE